MIMIVDHIRDVFHGYPGAIRPIDEFGVLRRLEGSAGPEALVESLRSVDHAARQGEVAAVHKPARMGSAAKLRDVVFDLDRGNGRSALSPSSTLPPRTIRPLLPE